MVRLGRDGSYGSNGSGTRNYIIHFRILSIKHFKHFKHQFKTICIKIKSTSAVNEYGVKINGS